MSNILIIGATGYYGKYLCEDSFFSNSYKVSRKKLKNKDFKNLNFLDIEKDSLYEKLGHINLDFIINLSTAKVESSWDQHYKNNEIGIKNIINFCNKKNITLIHFSSVVVYEKNNTDYKKGKILSEKNIMKFLKKGLILRSHLIATPDHKYTKILNYLLKFKFLKIFLPKKILNYKLNNPIHYKDVTNTLKNIIKKKDLFKFENIEKYDLKGPSSQTILEIFEGKRNKKTITNIEKKLDIRFNYLY